ncbi:MAG: EFR1 family ferrodoxin [Muribaculaceae bacterium]|nr:EFR1 family ferrodoxin [Muribaculaceae bacterium]
MQHKRLVFYFTATGNDLYVARNFSSEPLSIPQMMKRYGHGPMHWEADEIGIVYPIYWQKPPVMVQEFIRKSTFTCGYFFGILTYGCNCDNAPRIFTNLCSSCGITPDYVNAIIMVDNWLPGFDMNRQKALDPSKHIEEQIARQIDDVARHVSFIRRSVPNFEHGPTFPVEARDQFTITDDCVGCGICTRVCPCGNYRVVDGHAQASGGCEHCFACAQNCPYNAIYLTAGEANRHARYRNSHVTLQDIINANCQL